MEKVKKLTRTDILEGNYKYPEELISLRYTTHLKERFEERTIGLDFLPTQVKITKDNVHSGKTIDNEKLISVVVRIKYSSTKHLFICFNPYDGGTKTFWFREKKKGA